MLPFARHEKEIRRPIIDTSTVIAGRICHRAPAMCIDDFGNMLERLLLGLTQERRHVDRKQGEDSS